MSSGDALIFGLICGTLLMWLGLEPIDAGLVALLIWTLGVEWK